MKEIKSKVLEIKDFASDVRQLKLSVPNEFEFIPGQYISIKIPNEKSIIRSYSIGSSPKKEYIEICFKKIEKGIGTAFLFSLKVGDKLRFLGPLGMFTVRNNKKDLVFISTGTGIVPFRSIITNTLVNDFKGNITLIAGYKHEESILYNKEFEDLASKYLNFKYHTIFSKPKNNPNSGHVQDLIKKYVPPKFDGDFYICGLNEMIKRVTILLTTKGYKDKNIFYERYN